MDNTLFSLPQLPYDYNALGGRISEDIMRLHHDKHHQAYVDKLNVAARESEGVLDKPLEWVLSHLSELPEHVQRSVRNNGGGHYNHSQFWQIMSPQGGGEPHGEVRREIERVYGSYQGFVDTFTAKALDVFGSGWVWLQPDMSIVTTQNQDNPIMNDTPAPLMGLDVWEHAYYLDYQNKRVDYVNAWWDVVNWQFIEQSFQSKHL